MPAIFTADDWWERAACREVDPDLFFPISDAGPARQQIARAKAVCARCGVRPVCLDYALAARERHGVWGGLTEDERQNAYHVRERVMDRAS